MLSRQKITIAYKLTILLFVPFFKCAYFKCIVLISNTNYALLEHVNNELKKLENH